ncbi:MAG: adenylate kinase [Bacteroidia bacterium]|nr:adenylate kinase [Bacteroidia bacterium]
MKFYLLFGPPGAGKGTQAKLMVKTHNLCHVSTGDLLRQEISKGTEIGKLAKQLIDNGNFVPDEVVVEMIKKEISNNSSVNGFIFDGFPRTTAQAQILDQMLSESNEQVDKVISIIISDKVVFDRIKHRANIEGRKDDAADDIIQNRINTYHAKTEPLIEYYSKQGKYYEICGEGTIEEIYSKIDKLIN